MEDVLLGKIQKCIKENLLKVMSLMRQNTSSKDATDKIKLSFELYC